MPRRRGWGEEDGNYHPRQRNLAWQKTLRKNFPLRIQNVGGGDLYFG